MEGDFYKAEQKLMYTRTSVQCYCRRQWNLCKAQVILLRSVICASASCGLLFTRVTTQSSTCVQRTFHYHTSGNITVVNNNTLQIRKYVPRCGTILRIATYHSKKRQPYQKIRYSCLVFRLLFSVCYVPQRTTTCSRWGFLFANSTRTHTCRRCCELPSSRVPFPPW